MPLVFEQVTYRYPTSYDDMRGESERARKRRGDDTGTAPMTRSAKPAIENVSFEVRDGEFFSIIGHTGSGKSTIALHMNGLLQPSSGRVLLNGEDLTGKPVRKKARRLIGMAFQHPESQLFARTVAEDVAFAALNAGLPDIEVDDRVHEALEVVGLDYDAYARRSPFELSGGEMRRVALAGAIVTKPQILVLDEPTSALDPAAAERIMGLIKELNRAGTTIIMVSHSMELVARHSDRILVLNEGKVLSCDTPVETFGNYHELVRVNLALPGACWLATQLNDAGFDLRPDIFTTEFLADELARAFHERGLFLEDVADSTAPQGGEAR